MLLLFCLFTMIKFYVFLQVVTKTFHGAGLVVPVDKNDVGYRELPETDGNIFLMQTHAYVTMCLYI